MQRAALWHAMSCDMFMQTFKISENISTPTFGTFMLRKIQPRLRLNLIEIFHSKSLNTTADIQQEPHVTSSFSVRESVSIRSAFAEKFTDMRLLVSPCPSVRPYLQNGLRCFYEILHCGAFPKFAWDIHFWRKSFIDSGVYM
jgi:hypothetical protein